MPPMARVRDRGTGATDHVPVLGSPRHRVPFRDATPDSLDRWTTVTCGHGGSTTSAKPRVPDPRSGRGPHSLLAARSFVNLGAVLVVTDQGDVQAAFVLPVVGVHSAGQCGGHRDTEIGVPGFE